MPIRRIHTTDPKRSISFLHSRRSAKRNFFAMEISEAVVGDLNLPATTGRSASRNHGHSSGSSTPKTAGCPTSGHRPMLPLTTRSPPTAATWWSTAVARQVGLYVCFAVWATAGPDPEETVRFFAPRSLTQRLRSLTAEKSTSAERHSGFATIRQDRAHSR